MRAKTELTSNMKRAQFHELDTNPPTKANSDLMGYATEAVPPEIHYTKDSYGVYGKLSVGYHNYCIRVQAGEGYIYNEDFALIRIVEANPRGVAATLYTCRELCSLMARALRPRLQFYSARRTGQVCLRLGTVELSLSVPGEPEFTALGKNDNVYEIFTTPGGWLAQVSEIPHHGEVISQQVFSGPQPRLLQVIEQCYAHEMTCSA